MNNTISKWSALILVSITIAACGGNRNVVDDSADYKSARAFPGLKKRTPDVVVPSQTAPIIQKELEQPQVVRESIVEKTVITANQAESVVSEEVDQVEEVSQIVDEAESVVSEEGDQLTAEADTIVAQQTDQVVDNAEFDETTATEEVSEVVDETVSTVPAEVDQVIDEADVAVTSEETTQTFDDESPELAENINAVPVQTEPEVELDAQLISISDSVTRLQLSMAYEQAWIDIGERLKKNGFTIHNRNKVASEYEIGCGDITHEEKIIEKSGKWQFFKSRPEQSEHCAVRVTADNSATLISVFNRYGIEVNRVESQPILQRLLN